MKHVKILKGEIVAVSNEYPDECKNGHVDGWQSRWDWKTFEEVTFLAEKLTKFTNKKYLPVDRTDSTSPRYDVVEVPQVGDKVSRTFNGDTYPDGEIVKINASSRFIWTSTGRKYLRQGQTASWRCNGFSLTSGHFEERNPHF